MAGIPPIAPLLGAFAMLGVAAAALLGTRDTRPPDPPPAAGPGEDIRLALAAFAGWLARQPDPLRAAIAEPARALLADGANLAETLGCRPLLHPALIAAHGAIVTDLPDTIAILNMLPANERTVDDALRPLVAAIARIAVAAAAGWAAARAGTVDGLSAQAGYLGAKFPDGGPADGGL